MKPALTAEEWKRTRGVGRGEAWREVAGVEFYVHGHANQAGVLVVGAHPGRFCEVEPPLFHALAALCLHGQPFGFTREDVEILRDAIPVSAMNDLADRIESLLPPEEA